MGSARRRRIWSIKLRSLSNFSASPFVSFAFLRFMQRLFQDFQDRAIVRPACSFLAGKYICKIGHQQICATEGYPLRSGFQAGKAPHPMNDGHEIHLETRGIVDHAI